MKYLKFFMLSSFLLAAFSCQKEFSELKGSKWKLTGYADVQTGEFIVEESAPNCEDCNTLIFPKNKNGVGWVKVIVNTIEFVLSKEGVIGEMTAIDDSENGHLKLFYEAIKSIDSFAYTEDEFRFYYNNKQNYLLYKKVKS